MAAIDFPNNPAVGQQFVVGTETWTWDGVKWTAFPGALSIPDAPTDGQLYGRQFVTSSMRWAPASTPSGITDAPSDGTLYGRRSAGWSHATHNDITDWTASVPIVTTVTPKVDGTAAIGTDTGWAKGDHVHPTDTTRYAASNPASYITAAGAPVQTVATRTGNVILNHNDITDWSTAVAGIAQVNPNRLINGDMRIDQRNVGNIITPAPAAYTLDRWKYGATQTGKLQAKQNLNALTPVGGFPYYLGIENPGTAYTITTTDAFTISQVLEADTVGDLGWGTANAQPVTLSFWAQCSGITGTFSGSINNPALNRSYPFSFALPIANTWVQFVITIPGDSLGTWPTGGAGAGMTLIFNLGAGSTKLGAAGSTSGWANANFVGVTGSANILPNTVAAVYFTGVKLEAGSVATPFQWQSLIKSLADCQRYYAKTYVQFVPTGTGGNFPSSLCAYVGPTADTSSSLGVNWKLPITMRAQPTVVLYSPNNGAVGTAYMFGAGVNVSATASAISDSNVFLNLLTASVVAHDVARFNASADAEL